MAKKRVVVKIGSSSLTNERGEIDQEKFNDHVHAVASLRNEGHEVILVSSGAVAAGFSKLGYPTRPTTIKGKQAAAAVGQGLLIQSYIGKFCELGIVPAQILLTRSDFSDRVRYKNAYSTITELLQRKILPIINENDTVSVEELTFGDNDMLSALVSGLVHADQLIILTDVNGLYDADPRVNASASKINFLRSITAEMIVAADGAGSKIGTGGMKSKLLAARMALSLAVPVFIGKGKGPKKLLDILAGDGDGTYIGNSQLNSINTRRQWIAFHSDTTGRIYVDKGAEEAILYKGKSLLYAGVYKVKGKFMKGDVVEVFGESGLLGKGEVLISSDDLQEMIGKQKQMQLPSEVIHRNYWVRI